MHDLVPLLQSLPIPNTINLPMQVPGLDANFRDGAMMTPLMWSAFHGKPEHIEKLTERGAGTHFSMYIVSRLAL